ncbi:hypothetical protein D3C80_606190 [compost metagenome]
MGVLAHLGRHFAGQGADLLDMLAGDPELHRVAHGRAVFQARDPRTQVGELFIEGGDQPAAQLFTLLDGFRQHDELGETWRWQLLVQWQVEAWRTRAHIGYIVVDAGAFLEQRFQTLDLLGGITQRGAFGQLQVNHQLQAPGSREELLGHEAEQQNTADKQGDSRHDHRLAPLHAPADQAPHALVERCAIRIWPTFGSAMLGRVQLGQVRQQALAQIGHEHHRGNPRGEQGDGYHLEDRTGVFARSGLRGGNRQEAGGGDQGAGQHWEGGAGPGITGRLEPVETLLHLDCHHLHGNDGVIHQQAQGQHQRAEGDLVQADTEVVHGGKGHRQYQRNGQGHHQAGAHPQGEETHQQDDGQGLYQHLDELANAGLHRCRLVGHLAQLHAGRQIVGDAGELGFQGLAQHQDIAAGLHRYRQADGIFAHEAHARCGRIIEASAHIGDIADTEGAVTDPDRELLDLLDRGEAPADPQLQALGWSLEETRGAHRVLLFQRLLHRCQGQAEGGQLEVGQLDPDLLVLQAKQLDLADVLDPLQLDLHPVGVVLEHGVVEAITGQRVDVAEGGAEFIVEERPLNTLGQGVPDIGDLLADLVPKLGDVGRMHRIAGHEGDLRFTGP